MARATTTYRAVRRNQERAERHEKTFRRRVFFREMPEVKRGRLRFRGKIWGQAAIKFSSTYAVGGRSVELRPADNPDPSQ